MGRNVVDCWRIRLSASLLAALVVTTLATGAPRAAASTVKFRLVTEGIADSARIFSVHGATGLCEEAVEGRFEDQTTFLRGRGVTIEVSRHRKSGGWRYSVHRVGGRAAEFTVAAVRKRLASGSESLTPIPLVPPADCPAEHHELSKTPGCGTTRITHDDIGLRIIGSTSFTVAASEHGRVEPLPVPTCGETNTTKGFLDLKYEFPHFVDVAAQPLPQAMMFGRARAIAVKLEGTVSGGTAPSQPIGTPPLTGVATDTGHVDVTVRFIRCGEPHLPAC